MFSSSCATCGVHVEAPVRLGAAQAPFNPCGASKLMAKRGLTDCRTACRLQSAAMWYCAAGADPGGEMGRPHDPETHLIPSALDATSVDLAHTVHGNDHDSADARASATTSMSAILRTTISSRSACAGRVDRCAGMHLCGVAARSVAALIDIPGLAAGSNIPMVLGPPCPSEPRC